MFQKICMTPFKSRCASRITGQNVQKLLILAVLVSSVASILNTQERRRLEFFTRVKGGGQHFSHQRGAQNIFGPEKNQHGSWTDGHPPCKKWYTLHKKKITFSSSTFPGDPRLGSVTLGHFHVTPKTIWQNHEDHQPGSVTKGHQGK